MKGTGAKIGFNSEQYRKNYEIAFGEKIVGDDTPEYPTLDGYVWWLGNYQIKYEDYQYARVKDAILVSSYGKVFRARYEMYYPHIKSPYQEYEEIKKLLLIEVDKAYCEEVPREERIMRREKYNNRS